MDKVKGAATGAVNGVKSINWSDVKRNSILMAWMITGVATFLAPIIIWSVQKNNYYRAQGYYIDYENQQKQYEEEQNGNNNANYDGYRECGWWNLACKRQQMKLAEYYYGEDRNGGNGENENGNQIWQIPAWFIMLSNGASEAMQRWREENGGRRDDLDETAPTAGEIMVATYMFIAFFVVLILGFITFYKSKPLNTLKFALFFMIQMCLVNVCLLPSLINNEERMWDESIYGWYGQIGVLMAFFDFCVLIFSTVFIIIVGREAAKTATEKTASTDNDYNHMVA